MLLFPPAPCPSDHLINQMYAYSTARGRYCGAHRMMIGRYSAITRVPVPCSSLAQHKQRKQLAAAATPLAAAAAAPSGLARGAGPCASSFAPPRPTPSSRYSYCTSTSYPNCLELKNNTVRQQQQQTPDDKSAGSRGPPVYGGNAASHALRARTIRCTCVARTPMKSRIQVVPYRHEKNSTGCVISVVGLQTASDERAIQQSDSLDCQTLSDWKSTGL